MWATTVQMWARVGDPRQATKWFKRMVQAGCEPEVPAYNSLMCAFVSQGMYEEAEEVLIALKNGWNLVVQAEGGEEKSAASADLRHCVPAQKSNSQACHGADRVSHHNVYGAAANLMTYTMLLDACIVATDGSSVKRVMRLMEATGHPAHAVFLLLSEGPFGSTATPFLQFEELMRESEGYGSQEVENDAVCRMIERGLLEVEVREVWREQEEERWKEIETRMKEDVFCEQKAEDRRAFTEACIAFLHKFGRQERAARMWDLCHTRLNMYPNSVWLPSISGKAGACVVDLHGMSAGTAGTVTRWALEKLRQAVVASAASALADSSLTAACASEAIKGAPSAGQTQAGSSAAASGETPTAAPLQWCQPWKVAIVTGWGKRSRVQGASLVKVATEALLLRDLRAPFALHRDHPGSYEAHGAELEAWLLMPGVDQLLTPRDEGLWEDTSSVASGKLEDIS